MKDSDKDLVRLQHILEAIELIEKFTTEIESEEFAEDLMIQSAIIRQFEIIGETSANVSEESRKNRIQKLNGLQ